jgi:hypothetical protein
MTPLLLYHLIPNGFNDVSLSLKLFTYGQRGHIIDPRWAPAGQGIISLESKRDQGVSLKHVASLGTW